MRQSVQNEQNNATLCILNATNKIISNLVQYKQKTLRIHAIIICECFVHIARRSMIGNENKRRSKKKKEKKKKLEIDQKRRKMT